MKKYLFIALAALGFAACADKMDDVKSPVHNGELEESYIAINLMAADVDSRAVTDDIGNADEYGYEEGTTKERAIKTAYFFFFDENGSPFNVTGAPATAPGGSKNHMALTISDVTTSNMPNVSDIKEAVLVLNTYKGVYPKQVVAVLNWTPDQNTAYSLDDLHDALVTLGNDTAGYVMSNSVYMGSDSKMVDAVAITADNIKETSSAALAAPIDIYVERIAAKVVLTADGKVAADKNIFKVTTEDDKFTPVGGSSIDVYMKLFGWELYNDYNTSTLLKDIENWDPATIGLTWNDIPYYRSYWAKSQTTAISDSFSWQYISADQTSKGFKTEYGFAVASEANYTDATTYTYCGENTNGVDLRTKVILKGQLMKKIDETTYEPLEIASWYGNEYAGVDNLKTAVANSLAYTLYSGVLVNGSMKYTSITKEDIECVAGVAGAEAYEVGFQLSTAGQAKVWYLYSSEKGYEPFGNLDVTGDNTINTNAHLAAVEPALVYTSGMTYYFVDVKHLGATGKTAEYGVVRNHVYQIAINSITGFGTPIYNGYSDIVTPPEYPEDYKDTYVAARINVLSWKVVKQGVNIVQ